MEKRPTGITILALLWVIWGTCSVLFILFLWEIISKGFEAIGVSSELAYWSMGFLGLLYVITGICMWIGDPWGWWLSGFLLLYSIAQNVIAVLYTPQIVERLNLSQDKCYDFYMRYLVKTVVIALILYYLFRTTVVEYFKISSFKPWQRFLILLVASVIAASAYWLVSETLKPAG